MGDEWECMKFKFKKLEMGWLLELDVDVNDKEGTSDDIRIHEIQV